MFDDEVWDEHRWESFLRKDDERVSRYMKMLNSFLEEHPMPPADDEIKRQQWDEAFRSFLVKNGRMQDEFESSAFFLDHEEFDEIFEDFEIFEEDEEYLDEEPYERFETLPVYQEAFDLSSYVMKWSNRLPGHVKDSTLVQFCANVMQIPSNIAKGHGIGFEREALGGNIACLKRGIASANAALELLQEQKKLPYMDEKTYRILYEKTYEVRNQVGIYIQDLRDRFNLGID